MCVQTETPPLCIALRLNQYLSSMSPPQLSHTHTHTMNEQVFRVACDSWILLFKRYIKNVYVANVCAYVSCIFMLMTKLNH